MAAKNKTVIIVAGPTAVGKTAVAIQIAQYFKTEIISADSRQCYKEMNIGVARPSEEELQEVNHYFVASHSIHQKVNAVTFEQYALQKANELFEHHDVIVMAGGTGLYIKAFCEGMDEIPEVPEPIRNEINRDYQLNGLDWLQKQVQQLDPVFFQEGEIQNPQRLMRALEVFKATGRSITVFRKGEKAQRNFNIIKTGLELPKEKLHHNISARVNKMMEHGLMEEVSSLIPYQNLNALQTVGYKELFEFLNGKTSLPVAVEAIKKNTRHYAKRQMTWFRKDKEYFWFEPNDVKNIIRYIIDQTGTK
jgi:tRNA dimethylallyltransferase